MTNLDFLFERVDDVELRARLRVLHALVALYCGWEHPAKLAFDAVVFDNVSPAEALNWSLGFQVLPGAGCCRVMRR